MSTVEINQEVSTKLDTVRTALGRAIIGTAGVPADRSSSSVWTGIGIVAFVVFME